MLTFLINNPDRFATDVLIWPTIVCLTKIFTAFGAHIAAVSYLMYTSSELLTIKLYAGMAVIASLDGKLVSMIENMHSSELGSKTIEDYPLTIGVHQYTSTLDAIKKIWENYGKSMKTDDDEHTSSRIGLADVLGLTFAGIVVQITNLIYNTFYFYYGAFFPFITLLLLSNYKRHTPCTTEEDLRLHDTICKILSNKWNK